MGVADQDRPRTPSRLPPPGENAGMGESHERDRSLFLRELHGGFGMPRQEVAALVRRSTGDEVLDLARIVRGDENEVYRVNLAAGGAVYARILRPGLSGLAGEVWAMDQARHAGVPVPEVLAVEDIPTAEGERHAAVLVEARGLPLSGLLPSLSASERAAAMQDLGRKLALLHSVATPGAGRPDEGGAWPDPGSWWRRHQAEIEGRRPQLLSAGLAPDLVDRAIGLLCGSAELLTPVTPVLCHGDLLADHVFVGADRTVSDVIDWGLWQGGAAPSDLATIAIDGEEADLAAVIRGETGDWPGDPRLGREVSVAILDRVSGGIAWDVAAGNTADLRRMVPAFKRALFDSEARG